MSSVALYTADFNLMIPALAGIQSACFARCCQAVGCQRVGEGGVDEPAEGHEDFRHLALLHSILNGGHCHQRTGFQPGRSTDRHAEAPRVVGRGETEAPWQARAVDRPERAGMAGIWHDRKLSPTVGENDVGTARLSVPFSVAEPVTSTSPNAPLAGVPSIVSSSEDPGA